MKNEAKANPPEIHGQSFSEVRHFQDMKAALKMAENAITNMSVGFCEIKQAPYAAPEALIVPNCIEVFWSSWFKPARPPRNKPTAQAYAI